ncbi:MAG: hemerythrin domain-containing protein, partial [Nocardioides sp.]
PHVRREEQGVFAALRQQEEYVEEVELLEREHVDLDEALAALDPASPGFERDLTALLETLGEHVERENLGIFPVSVVTLGASGWALVEEARASVPIL